MSARVFLIEISLHKYNAEQTEVIYSSLFRSYKNICSVHLPFPNTFSNLFSRLWCRVFRKYSSKLILKVYEASNQSVAK